MGNAPPTTFVGRPQGACITCQAKFVGPGDRCQSCKRQLQLKLAKRRRRRG